MTNEYDFNVTMTDILAAGHCVAGAKSWATTNNIDWHRFIRGGVPAQELLDTGDGQALQVVTRTLAIRNGGQ